MGSAGISIRACHSRRPGRVSKRTVSRLSVPSVPVVIPRLFLCTAAALSLAGCAFAGAGDDAVMVVSVPDQKLVVLQNGARVAQFKVSTSKFGVGDGRGSYATPLGNLAIAHKIGANAPLGAVFKGRRATGEVLRPNSKGRDPIVTRILWLRGLDEANRHAYRRGIYIHGTPAEKLIGKPASYGCIRMRSRDVIKLFDAVGIGARVEILNLSLNRAMSAFAAHHRGGDQNS